MLFRILAILLLLATPAFADELAPDSSYESNRPDALHHRPAQREVWTTVGLSACPVGQESNSAYNAKSVTNACTRARLGLAFAPWDWLLLEAAENYLIDGGSTLVDYDGSTRSIDVRGFSSPTLGANVRYWGGLNGTFFGSAYALVVPNLGSSRAGSATQAGNNLPGGTSFTLGNHLYWVRGPHEFEWLLFATMFATTTHGYDKGMGPLGALATSYHSDPYVRFNTRFAYRLHMADRFFVNLSLDLAVPFDVTFQYDALTYYNTTISNASATQVHFALAAEPRVEFGWRPLRNLVLTAGVSESEVHAEFGPTSFVETRNTLAVTADVAASFGF